MDTTWHVYNLSERSFFSFAISSPRKYWNFFSSPVVKGFRAEFAVIQNFNVNYFFNKAINFLTFVAEKNRTRFLLFGLDIPDLDLTLSTTYGNRGHLRVFFELLNIAVIGNVWIGGALTNFKKFKIHNTYYFFKISAPSKFRYYPTVALSAFYNYETLSLGFESMSCAVPIISPIDASLDPAVLGYPIPMSSSRININFMSNFFLLKILEGSLIRFVNFSVRNKQIRLKFGKSFITERWN